MAMFPFIVAAAMSAEMYLHPCEAHPHAHPEARYPDPTQSVCYAYADPSSWPVIVEPSPEEVQRMNEMVQKNNENVMRILNRTRE